MLFLLFQNRDVESDENVPTETPGDDKRPKRKRKPKV